MYTATRLDCLDIVLTRVDDNDDDDHHHLIDTSIRCDHYLNHKVVKMWSEVL